MPECIRITNGHEHTAGEVHTVHLPELLESPPVLDDLPAVYPEYQVDDRWHSKRWQGTAMKRSAQLGLICSDSRGSPWPTQRNTTCVQGCAKTYKGKKCSRNSTFQCANPKSSSRSVTVGHLSTQQEPNLEGQSLLYPLDAQIMSGMAVRGNPTVLPVILGRNTDLRI